MQGVQGLKTLELIDVLINEFEFNGNDCGNQPLSSRPIFPNLERLVIQTFERFGSGFRFSNLVSLQTLELRIWPRLHWESWHAQTRAIRNAQTASEARFQTLTTPSLAAHNNLFVLVRDCSVAATAPQANQSVFGMQYMSIRNCPCLQKVVSNWNIVFVQQ